MSRRVILKLKFFVATPISFPRYLDYIEIISIVCIDYHACLISLYLDAQVFSLRIALTLKKLKPLMKVMRRNTGNVSFHVLLSFSWSFVFGSIN